MLYLLHNLVKVIQTSRSFFMKKLVSLILFFAASCLFMTAYAFDFKLFKFNKNQTKQEVSNIEILPTMNSASNAKNQVWVGTFQLVWNDLTDEIIKHPIKFTNTNSVMADNLNQKSFSVNDISENAYYKKWGLVSPETKQIIESGIKKKFNETSDILNKINWKPEKGKYILYAMLKKDLVYTEKLHRLKNGYFEGSKAEVKYFGIENHSTQKQREVINVLFYNNSSDFAVALNSTQGDKVFLYRTNDSKTLSELYNDMNSKTKRYRGKISFGQRDEFKAPIIDFKSEREFEELCNKPIKNSKFEIAQAIETVQFKMDEAGVILKSEAAIITRLTSVMPAADFPRYFHFNNKYVIFVAENGKKPYFAMLVSDAAKLQK